MPKILKVSLPNNVDIEVPYERWDNVISVKRIIRNIAYIDERKLFLCDDINILGNNEYLSNSVRHLSGIIREENFQNYIVIEIEKNSLNVPLLFQVQKSDNIADVKEEMREIAGLSEEIIIFKEDFNEPLKHFRIPDEYTVERSNLVNDSKIKVCRKVDIYLDLKITYILPSTNTFNISEINGSRVNICDSVKEIKKIICNHIKCQGSISLFSELEFIDDEKYLIDYSLRNDNMVFYVQTVDKRDFEIGPVFHKGKFSELHFEKNKDSPVILKRYKLNVKKAGSLSYLKNEIITFLRMEGDCHPNIIRMEYMFELNGFFYIALEYVKEGSLANRLPVTKDKLWSYSMQIADALQILHENKIIYLNLKCSNILLFEGSIKLCDFHFSKYLQEYSANDLMKDVVGGRDCASNWSAPEVLSSMRYGVKADIWSFGATLIEMSTGHLTSQQVKSDIKTMEYDSSKVPSAFHNIIQLCITVNPNDRPTAQQLIEKIKKIEN